MRAPLLPTFFAFSSELGPLTIEWRGDMVCSLRFSASEREPEPEIELSVAQHATIDRLRRYALGEPVDLNSIPIDLSEVSTFTQRVYRECRKIAPGMTISYGQLAARAGSPKGARAVGGAMARNRIPLLIPCHRVVASTGKLHGFSAPQGLRLKDRLLRLEREAIAETKKTAVDHRSNSGLR
ncbi:MAG: methylated-DNA--[protein]-cysteine S-methyltransferase [Blastopirellula sp. JB062]